MGSSLCWGEEREKGNIEEFSFLEECKYNLICVDSKDSLKYQIYRDIFKKRMVCTSFDMDQSK